MTRTLLILVLAAGCASHPTPESKTDRGIATALTVACAVANSADTTTGPAWLDHVILVFRALVCEAAAVPVDAGVDGVDGAAP